MDARMTEAAARVARPVCKRCHGTGIECTTVMGVTGTGVCAPCALAEKLVTPGGSKFIAVRGALIDAPGITLDGAPAVISGRLCEHATVIPVGDCSRSVPFAWETVRRVVTEKGGAFRS